MNEFDPNYQAELEQYDAYGFVVLSDLISGVMSEAAEERIGMVRDVLVNEKGQLQYLVVDLGLPTVCRQVLLSGDRIRIDKDKNRVYAVGISRKQAEDLPEYSAEAMRNQARARY
ncbi:PRC-barrel domain-containing protein [Phormidium tenue FACHB-886]|nr:PRC-barrel domain-containing protein [Phormidium tenue FACHB-886]